MKPQSSGVVIVLIRRSWPKQSISSFNFARWVLRVFGVHFGALALQ